MAKHDELWAQSAARVGFTVHNDLPHIGVSGDTGPGYIVPLPAPEWFASIRDEGTRDNVLRAMAAHALRVGQAKLKAEDNPTRQHAADGVALALNGGYKPARSRDNDIADTEAAKMFRAYVAEKAIAAKPNATEADIAETVKAQSETPRGKELLAQYRTQVLEQGTYTVTRKGSGGGKAAAVTVEL